MNNQQNYDDYELVQMVCEYCLKTKFSLIDMMFIDAGWGDIVCGKGSKPELEHSHLMCFKCFDKQDQEFMERYENQSK